MYLFFQELGGLSGAFWPTIIGAIVGAIVGGLISFLLQIYGVKIAQRERLASKRQSDLATAFNVTVKVIKMMSNLRNLKKIVDQAVERLKTEAQTGGELWQFMLPVLTVPAEIKFSSEEAAFILSTGRKDLILKTLEFADIHNNFLHIVTAYALKREIFRQSCPVDTVQHDMTRSTVDQSTMNKLCPLIVELKSLANQMVERSAEDFNLATKIFESLKSHNESRFGKDFPKIQMAD
jgi:hypothetical protein